MKTTIELPDRSFRQAKILAAGRGITLKQFFTEALEEKLRNCVNEPSTGKECKESAPWMAGFGALSDLSNENRHILGAIEEEFETLTPEDIA